MFIRKTAAVIGLGLLACAGAASAASNDVRSRVTKQPKCEIPFPDEALRNAPAGFKGETLALISFTAKGEFRSARLLRSSGNEALDSAALRAAVEAKCEPLVDPKDEELANALIGIPYGFMFDNSRGSGPAEVLPVR